MWLVFSTAVAGGLPRLVRLMEHRRGKDKLGSDGAEISEQSRPPESLADASLWANQNTSPPRNYAIYRFSLLFSIYINGAPLLGEGPLLTTLCCWSKQTREIAFKLAAWQGPISIVDWKSNSLPSVEILTL